jgi:hypothetical protein
LLNHLVGSRIDGGVIESSVGLHIDYKIGANGLYDGKRSRCCALENSANVEPSSAIGLIYAAPVARRRVAHSEFPEVEVAR